LQSGKIILTDIVRNKTEKVKYLKELTEEGAKLAKLAEDIEKLDTPDRKLSPNMNESLQLADGSAESILEKLDAKKKKFESVQHYKQSLRKVLLKDDPNRKSKFLMSCSTWQMMKFGKGESNHSCSAIKYEFEKFNSYPPYGTNLIKLLGAYLGA